MDLFTDEDAVFIFLSIRINEQTNTIKQRKIVKKISEQSKIDDDLICTNIEELISGLIYLSGFSKKFNMNYEHGISISSFDDVVELSMKELLHDNEIYMPYGDMQYIGNVSYFQKMIEYNDVYISPNVCNEGEKHYKKACLDGYFFPVPIYVNKDIEENFTSFESKMDEYCNEDEFSIDMFRKKDFSLFTIPNHIISFLNSIDNCNRTFFEF